MLMLYNVPDSPLLLLSTSYLTKSKSIFPLYHDAFFIAVCIKFTATSMKHFTFLKILHYIDDRMKDAGCTYLIYDIVGLNLFYHFFNNFSYIFLKSLYNFS